MDRTQRQALCVDNWVKNKCKGTVVAATGFGKTNVALIAMQRFFNKNPKASAVIIVPSTDLKQQWSEKVVRNKLSNVSVLVINTAIKNLWKANLVIIDECHRINAITFRKVLENKSYSLILGLTATYERLDNLQKVVLDKYCPPCDTITHEEAARYSWVSPINTYLVLIDVSDISLYRQYHQKFIGFFSTFGYDFKLAMALGTDFSKRIQYIKQNSIRLNKSDAEEYSKYITASAFGFMKMLKLRKSFIHNHPKKLEIARKILESNSDKKAITFWKTIKMADALKMGYTLHSKLTDKKRKITLQDFKLLKTGNINCSKALDEGVDIPGLSLGIVCGLDSSSITANQRRGRICRFEPNKTAEMYYIVIKDTVEESWFRNAIGTTDYITLTEEELLNKLQNKTFKHINNKNSTKNDVIFRY